MLRQTFCSHVSQRVVTRICRLRPARPSFPRRTYEQDFHVQFDPLSSAIWAATLENTCPMNLKLVSIQSDSDWIEIQLKIRRRCGPGVFFFSSSFFFLPPPILFFLTVRTPKIETSNLSLSDSGWLRWWFQFLPPKFGKVRAREHRKLDSSLPESVRLRSVLSMFSVNPYVSPLVLRDCVNSYQLVFRPTRLVLGWH